MSDEHGVPGTGLPLAVGGVLLLGIAVWAGWSAGREPPTYVPGEEVEGVVSQLSREVPKDYPSARFTDVAEQAGIDVRHFPGTRTNQLPEDMGSGLAWGDYDSDGYADLYVVNSGPMRGSGDSGACSRLYRNDGDGTFTDVTDRAGVQFCGVGMGAAWGDYDGDGRPDLYVSAYGPDRLFHNEGNGTFRDVTAAAGLDSAPEFSGGAAWGDYDGDGRLDLYVTCYVRYTGRPHEEAVQQYDTQVPSSLNPSSFPPCPNHLYRNDGDGTFTDVARQQKVADPNGRSLGAMWVDVSGDGRLDLYVANDVSDNRLYRNLGPDGFRDASHEAGVADYRGAMGLAAGDWDGDTDLDLFITHWIAQENALYRNLRREYATGERAGERPRPTNRADEAGQLLFVDIASPQGLGQQALDYVGWGTFFFDYDNDGRLDLFVANGSTLQDDRDPEQLVPMDDQLFWNSAGRKGFHEVSSAAGSYFRTERVGRGAARADYDRDGDLDVAVLNHGRGVTLLRNDGGNAGHWLQVHLEGESGPPIGARVRVSTGDRTQVREVGAQGSYLSQSSRVQHFGLGDAERVDTLTVRWPTGRVERRTDVAADRRITVRPPEKTDESPE